MDISFSLRIFVFLVIFHLTDSKFIAKRDLVDGSTRNVLRFDEQTAGLASSNNIDGEVVGMFVASGVFLIVLLIIVFVVFKRQMKNKNEVLTLQRKLAEIKGLRLNIEIERLTIEKRRLETEENKLAAFKS